MTRAILAAPIDPWAMALDARRQIPTVEPVTVTVRQMDESRLAILTRPGGPLTAEEWARVEGEL